MEVMAQTFIQKIPVDHYKHDCGHGLLSLQQPLELREERRVRGYEANSTIGCIGEEMSKYQEAFFKSSGEVV